MKSAKRTIGKPYLINGSLKTHKNSANNKHNRIQEKPITYKDDKRAGDWPCEIKIMYIRGIVKVTNSIQKLNNVWNRAM